MILTNYVIGFIEDNAGLFSLSRLISGLKGCTDFVGYPTGLCQNLLTSNQPFIFIPAFLLAQMLNPVLAYNLIVLGGTALNFFFAFRFFKKLFGRFIAVLLATIFIASPYLAYQSRSHFDLLQFWPVIWFLDTLFFSQSRHKAIFLGLLLTLITGISNYLGYFTLVMAGLYIVASFLTKASFRAKRGTVMTMKPAKRVAISVAIFVLSSSLFMAPYIKSNYFSPQVRIEESIDDRALSRPFEDFVTFSSRPWYYLLPSVDNPFFGGLSQKFLNRLSGGGNYLAQNYFKAEHSASYLGWVNLSLALVGLVALVIARRSRGDLVGIATLPSVARNDKRNPLVPPNDKAAPRNDYLNIPALLITIVALIILTMPPSVTIDGMTIITPSYILFKVFPMFRVLARAGIFILFLTLIFTGYGYSALVSGFPATRRMGRRTGSIRRGAGIRKTQVFITIPLMLFSVTEFFIPLKITHVGTPPQVYAYIEATDPLKSPIVVYPYNKTNEALFWMTTHKQPLINPRMYENKETGFASDDFTNLLNTTRGLEKARNMGAKYLVYFYNGDGSFFNSSLLLAPVNEFKEVNQAEQQLGVFVRIVEAGSAVSNSAILYKFR